MEKWEDVFFERTAVLRSQASWETPGGFWLPQGYFYVLDGMQSRWTKERKDFPWEIVIFNQSSEYSCIWERVDIFKILYLIQLPLKLFVKDTPACWRKEKAGHLNFSCVNKKYTYHMSIFLEKKHKNSWDILFKQQQKHTNKL